MTPIKLIIIIALIVILRAFLVQPSLLFAKRLIALGLFLVLLLLVLFPEISTRIANLTGVGRGVDLVFYVSHLFLTFLIIALWRKTVSLEEKLTRVSRLISLANPVKETGDFSIAVTREGNDL